MDQPLDDDKSADQRTLEKIAQITRRSFRILRSIQEYSQGVDPDTGEISGKSHRVRYSVKQAAEMVERTDWSIRDAENKGRLPAPDIDPKTNRRLGYRLDQVNTLREYFGTLPHRGVDDPPAIISVQNFKGGVGKSCMTTHLAHGFAALGYRVLVIDADPQATTTSVFGFNPDLDVSAEDTLGPYLLRDIDTLEPVIRKTHVDQVDLIPSQLRLHDAEYVLASQIPSDPEILDMLRTGVRHVARSYDIVLIDPPPALGMIPLSVLRAANALLVPVRPSMIDFSSTVNFFSMLEESIEALARRFMSPTFHWTRILINDIDEGKSMQSHIARLMERVYESDLLPTRVLDSAEIDNAAGRLCTVFELTEVSTSRETRRRAVNNLSALVSEVEQLIHTTWPQRAAELRRVGRL